MALYDLQATLILPFRPLITEGRWTGTLHGDRWTTTFVLQYRDDEVEILEGFKVSLRTCTLVAIKTSLVFDGDREQAVSWAEKNRLRLSNEHIIPRLNQFFLHLKKANPSASCTGVLRNIGQIDLVLQSVTIDGQGVGVSGASTIIGGNRTHFPVELNLSAPITKEWAVLTRAVDLVNHGYTTEALVVCFALLDDVVQTFLESRLPNLERDEAHALLRRIETRRLDTFLGPMMRLAFGESPLDTPQAKADLQWLNEKRNAVMHRGEECSDREARRALEIVVNILEALKRHGAKLDLPHYLAFWP